MSSIRLRIIVFILLAQILINIFSGHYIYQHTESEIEELFDAEQAQLARTIAQLVADVTIKADLQAQTTNTPAKKGATQGALFQGSHPYERKIAYQVWDNQDVLLIKSENAPIHPLGRQVEGYSRWLADGTNWSVFSLYSPKSQLWIYTAQSTEARQELIALITQDQIVSAIIVNLWVLLIVVFGVLFGTRPIVDLNEAIQKRDDRNLNPIDLRLAKELEPIRNAINRLMRRLESALKKERSFNEDLAHELRTPLAAIKIHAQTLELQEDANANARKSLSYIVSGIGIISDTIEQLLQLNRISSEQEVLMQENVPLDELAKEVLVHLPHNMHAKHEISLEGTPCQLQGNRTLLGIMIRNLIENAVKYSESGSEIIIKTSQVDSVCILEVIDEGPGMSAQQKENSTLRHYRVSDSQAYGSGLGLSIVQKVVDLHGAKLGFFDRPGQTGLIVRVTFEISQAAELV